MIVIWGGGNTQQLASSSTPVYVYNGVITDEKAIDFTNDNISEAFGYLANDEKHYIFDNETDLLTWAGTLDAANRDKLVNLIQDRQALRAIAVSTNAQAYAETHKEEPPQDFIDQTKAYLQNKYGQTASVRSYGYVWDNCPAWGASFPQGPGTVSWYPKYIRNKMSGVQEIGILGTVFFTRPFYFGGAWYFNPIYHVFGVCLENHWFNNNQVSSIGGF